MSPQEEHTEAKNNTPNENKETSDRSHKSVKCDRKCMHQGDRICYNEEPDKIIIKKVSRESPPSGSSDSLNTDSIHSGESLYKTFQFDTQDNDPDMEKCMTFWKNILAKNVKPVKCTLLKSKKEENVQKAKVQREDPCEKEETKKLWLDVYKDLQRRRLDKVKLVKKYACKPCEDYIDEEEEKKRDSEEIKKLNEWKSRQHRAIKLDVKSQVKRTLQALEASRSSEGVKNRSKESVREEIVTSVTTQPLQESPKENPKIENNASNNQTSVNVNAPSEISQPKQAEIKVTVQKPITEISEKFVETKESEVCCKCGCDVGECICDEIEDLITDTECYPCNCGTTCTCENTKICPCGCRVQDCICGDNDECPCGCRVKECLCTQVDDTYKKCTCGCGFEECICEQLFTRSCKCGQEDCTCDMVEILSAYLESLNTPINGEFEKNAEVKMVSSECQTEDEYKWMQDTVQMKGTYCIICGHFNCFCKLDKRIDT